VARLPAARAAKDDGQKEAERKREQKRLAPM
jgi:hypothetical protein